jgi:hypothetical protein
MSTASRRRTIFQPVEKAKLAKRIYSTNQSHVLEKHLIDQAREIGLFVMPFVTFSRREYAKMILRTAKSTSVKMHAAL